MINRSILSNSHMNWSVASYGNLQDPEKVGEFNVAEFWAEPLIASRGRGSHCGLVPLACVLIQHRPATKQGIPLLHQVSLSGGNPNARENWVVTRG
jgi:hypothetical protein